jgi:hypothetical protein
MIFCITIMGDDHDQVIGVGVVGTRGGWGGGQRLFFVI